MRTFRDLRIGTQMRVSFGIVFVFVLGLGFLAARQAHLLWENTHVMYNHPVQVQRAIGSLEANVLSISCIIKDIFIVPGHMEDTSPIVVEIQQRRDEIFKNLDTLADRYLGPPEDIAAIRSECIAYNTLIDDTFRLIRSSQWDAAMLRTQSQTGVTGIQAQRVLDQIKAVKTFARNKADELYVEATQKHITLERQLIIFIVVILLLSFLISWYLINGIKDPIEQLNTAADQFRQGNLDTRSGYGAHNELGQLSSSFNKMADTIETEMRIDERASQITDVMLRAAELRSFCQELLTTLMAHTKSQIGAVYILDSAQTCYDCFESIGLSAGCRTGFLASIREGEFGPVLSTGRIQRIVEIPADTDFVLPTVGGDFRPREIITIPLLSNGVIASVISLASVQSYDDNSIRLINEIWETMTARMNGVLAYRQIQHQADQLEQQNRELNVQKQELSAQTTELEAMNTELEMQARQLNEANRLKSTFLSNMSHELRTPLNSVIALSGVLNRRLLGTIPDDEFSYLEVIERNGKHLLSLINDILDLSRIEAGREEINVSSFSVRNLVADILSMIDPQAREKGIALSHSISHDVPTLTSDADKCSHILQNLISNAVKFTDSGSVDVSAWQVKDQIHIAVRDTGIGIAANQIHQIFEEFRQIDDSAARRYGGTGLGLAIARNYARLLNGDIIVDSTPGSGSVFTLRLPIHYARSSNIDQSAKEVSSEVTDAGSEQKSIPRPSSRYILLVEDNAPAVIQLVDILKPQGYRIEVAHDGSEALEHINRELPDVVILDLMMPQMDGFELLKVLRSADRTLGLPVIILTAKHISADELKFLKGNHIHQLIQKGDVSKTELLNAVARIVEPPEAPVRARSDRSPPVGKPVVLVVEDNPDNLKAMRALLQESCTVVEAMDGREGIQQAHLHKPDIILMDIAMPVMDGFAALAAIRADKDLQHIPVIAVTASAMSGDREHVMAHGFDGYISKPVDPTGLRKTLNEVLYGKPHSDHTGH